MSVPATATTPFRKTLLGKLLQRVSRKGRRLRKEIYQRVFLDNTTPRKVLLVFGCQRSGTTMLGYVLANDLRSAVLQEYSCITQTRSLRLRSCREINQILSSSRAPLIVAKPIVESQRADELLREINNSRGVWMYRNFRDVVCSNIKRFRTQVEGLKSVVTGTPKSWRNERVSEETKSILKRFYRDDISRTDAAALGWYCRNALFFESRLDQCEAMQLCRYEHLVTSPDEAMREIYRHLGVDRPRYCITNDIDQQSLGHGNHVEIDDGIALLCETLHRRLEDCYAAQQRASQLDHRSSSCLIGSC